MFFSMKSLISSLIIGSMISLTGCGTPAANNNDSETKWLPAIFYVLVVASTGMTVHSMIKTHNECMRKLQELKRRDPNTSFRCEQRAFRG